MACVFVLLLLLLLLPMQRGVDGEVSLNCPSASCWHYWSGNCYCIESNQKGTWSEALRFCKKYRETELVTLRSILEKNWLLSLPLDNFWLGLNNFEDRNTFSWSEGTPANMRLPWLQVSHSVQSDTPHCVKVSKLNLVALPCNSKAHWICKRNAVVDRYQAHRGKVLLSPPGSATQVHSDLSYAKAACLEFREQCTGITTWNNSYALTRGTVLIKSEETQAVAYVKSDCSLGYFGTNCSFVCSSCYGDELCNPYTGMCDNFHSCSFQHSPAVCEQALTSIWCPRFSGWKYWENNCYYFSNEPNAKWIDARKQCRRFRNADLLWIESKNEMNWISSVLSDEIFWTGLNSRKQNSIWVWSNSKSAAKLISWLSPKGPLSGRCVGLNKAEKDLASRLNCEKQHKWICKRKEMAKIFDVYISRYQSGPLEPTHYTSLSTATLDCLNQRNCTGIVQDYQYYRVTTGIDEIYATDEKATSYVRRECSFGYYGDNCASVCLSCYGGFRCSAVTGLCPERRFCVGHFKGELCELGIQSPKCPQNGLWWYYDGSCYYFEKEETGQHGRASQRCSYYKEGNLVKIDSEKEKLWLGAMLKSDSWIGLLHVGTEWQWSGGRGKVDISKYNWLKDISESTTGCAQMLRGGRLRSIPCTESHLYICEIKSGLDPFIDYPGKIILAIYPLAVYKNLDEAKFHCILHEDCIGISSWPDQHLLVNGTEMVAGSSHHIFHMKTSCKPGRYGRVCEEECPVCRDHAYCNMLTGFCDENTTCTIPTTLESCAQNTISENCPDVAHWHYWNKHCYYFSNGNGMKWTEANSTCSRFKATELLWIEDQAEWEWLQIMLNESTWIGLQDNDHNKIWTWSHEDDASSTLKWLSFPKGKKKERCAEISFEGVIKPSRCNLKKKMVCKKPSEPDHDVYAGFWDSVAISDVPLPSANSTYSISRQECIRQKSKCVGYGLWDYGYFLTNGSTLVGGGFGPSATFLKSACDYGYYGPDCKYECPDCHWDKPCHPITGKCESSIVCAKPHKQGMCNFGLYSLKCPLGVGWWYRKGKCYLIDKSRRVTWHEAQDLCSRFREGRLLVLDDPKEQTWAQNMISESMWIGLSWKASVLDWQWENGMQPDSKWITVEGARVGGCATIQKTTTVLRSVACTDAMYFICERKEDIRPFQLYRDYIITQKQDTLPQVFQDLESAQEDCIFEKSTCTGVIFSQGQYRMVSGLQAFPSEDERDELYVKTGCNPGFHGTNCQSKCKPCLSKLPCHGISGDCLMAGVTKCSLDSRDPKCWEGGTRNLCPRLPNWYLFSKSCYYVEENKTETWAIARTACQGFKGTDLVKITSSIEKMWVQIQGDNSWIGMIFSKMTYQYLWLDNSSSVLRNAWVVRRNRRHTQTLSDCGVSSKKYLTVANCSEQKNWICKRPLDVDLFTEHVGRAFFQPSAAEDHTFASLNDAKRVCFDMHTCNGVGIKGKLFVLHTGTKLYNTRNKSVKAWFKSDCAAGRFGRMCELPCHKCETNVSCNPITGLCADSLFCSKDDSDFHCTQGSLVSGKCLQEDGWLYWNGNCYYRFKEKKIWIDARDACRQFRDTDLVWLTSLDEKKWLISNLPQERVWIGLRGYRFCTRLQWSFANFSFTPAVWLYNSWTIYWSCCLRLERVSLSLTAGPCYSATSWVCKKREEETTDFLKFDGYYLAGTAKRTKNVTYRSLPEAFQECRFQRALCNGVQRAASNYVTVLATHVVFVVTDSFIPEYTAYLKSACTPGFYGPQCSIKCTCNGTDNCDPLTGECVENEQCFERYIASKCEKGVINLKCPKDPGWWYWNKNCYYIETVNLLTWKESWDFCTAYHETQLMPQPSAEEELLWLASMITDSSWIAPGKARAQDSTAFKEKSEKATGDCMQVDVKGTINQVDCFTLASWVCKRSLGTDMFWENPEKIFLKPLGNKMYASMEHAKSACFLEEQCTGISYWKTQFVPVSGKELVSTRSKMDASYTKTACSEGRYGSYCQKRCRECPKDRPCNRLTGNCEESEVICHERKSLWLCELELTSKYCFHSWRYFSGRCYYFSSFGELNKSEADYMCSRYKGGQLLHLDTPDEKDWVTKVISNSIWLQGVSQIVQPKSWLPRVEKRLGQRSIQAEELCLQLEPELGVLTSSPCSYNSSWACEAPLASQRVDAPYKWWVMLTSSFIITTIIMIVSVFVTFKLGHQFSKVKPKQLVLDMIPKD